MKEDFDHIKKRLREYESPIQLDEAWDALQTHQQRRQSKWKRTSGVLLLFLLIGSCGTCWLLGKRNGSSLQTPVQEEALLHTAKPVEQWSQPGNNDKNPVFPAAGYNHENTTLTHSDKHTTTGSSITGSLTPETVHPSANPGLSTSQLQNQPTNSSENTQRTSILNNDMSGIFPPAPTQQSMQDGSLDSGNTSSAVTPENDRADSASPVPQSTAGNASTWITWTMPPAVSPQRLWWMEVLPEKTSGMVIRSSQTPLTLPVVKIGLSPIRTTRKTPVRKTISLSAGTVLAQQNFKSRTIEQAEYAALRTRTESGLPGLSTDLGISLEVSQRNYVDVALRYDTWYDQFVYQYEQSKEYTLTNVLLGVVQYEPIGTQVRVFGDTVITGTQTVKATYYNRYAAADVRLAFGRTLWNRHRFSLDLTAGLSANIYKKIQGHIADSGLANSVIELQYMPYKQTLGLGAYADLRLNYRLTSWLDIQFRPSAILGLSDALQSNAPSSARFRRTSLQLGLRTRF